MATLHVIGAGLAGLACAVDAARAGHRVEVHDAAPQPGGRCRSFFDETIGRTIDNGTHLLLSANRAVLDYAAVTGGGDRLSAAPCEFPFADLTTGERWTVRPNMGRVPWWIFSQHRRLPGTGASDYLRLFRLPLARSDQTVAGLCGGSKVYDRLIEPLSTAILNTGPQEASARLLGRVLRETLALGGEHARPVLAPQGLGAALVEPAVRWLEAHGVALHMADPLLEVREADGRVAALRFRRSEVAMGPGDQVVLAVPPPTAHRLLPEVVPPLEMRPIVNAHFVAGGRDLPAMLGLVGGRGQWLFSRGDVLSMTVSAATDLVDVPAEDLAAVLWTEASRVLGKPKEPLPPWRIVKEHRATLAHCPRQEVLRPGPRTPLANLVLAGDWTATGLPCTLEGAVRSGRRAASLLSAG